jgi:PPOX class probable F420-dependent enzyme
MWYVQDDDALYVRTYAGAGKLRRLAGAPEVLVAPSNGRSRPSDAGIPATARVLEGSEASRAYAMLDRAFGVRSYDAAYGGGPGRIVVLAIEPVTAMQPA